MHLTRRKLVILCGLVTFMMLMSFVLVALNQVHLGYFNKDVNTESYTENFSHNTAMCVPPDIEQRANNSEAISSAVSCVKLSRTDGITSAKFVQMAEIYIYYEILIKGIKSIFNRAICSGVVMIC